MARPTDDPKTEVLRVRITKEMSEKLSAMGNKSDVIRELIVNAENALTGVNTGIMGDLTMMCNLYGITVNDLLTDLCEKVDKGEIRIENGKIALN